MSINLVSLLLSLHRAPAKPQGTANGSCSLPDERPLAFAALSGSRIHSNMLCEGNQLYTGLNKQQASIWHR